MSVARLALCPLPAGDPPRRSELTWLDLALHIAAEYDVRIEDIATDATLARATVQARHYLWGVLRGAGIGYALIAMVWNVDPSRVRNGVLLASDRLGIAVPVGDAPLTSAKSKGGRDLALVRAIEKACAP